MLNLAICDNNKKHLVYTEKFIKECSVEYKFSIRSFQDAELLLESVNCNSFVPDILVLDIQLGAMDGIELAKRINAMLPLCQIIFLTGFSSYVSDVYTTNHIFFIMKDNMEKYLPSAIEKAVSFIETQLLNENRLYIKTNGKVLSICISDILYLERNLRKTEIVTRSSRLLVSMHPSELLGELHKPMFIQCHQSYWVNFLCISSMEANSFTLTNGDAIPISRARKGKTKDTFFSLIQK